MQFPEKPTCHPPMGAVFVYGNDFSWNPPRPFDKGPNTHLSHHCRTCSYCGSIHPEDFLRLIEQGATLEIADFKYGWPHKFYVNAPNPNKGRETQCGSRSYLNDQGVRVEEPIMGTEGDLSGKWYNAHLGDEGLDREAFDAIANAILRLTNGRIIFDRDPDGRVKWGCRR